MAWIEWLLVGFLAFIGIWLSAFFSGSETAYYRLSVLRVNVEAQGGNKAARKMLWFIRHPGEFVATVLIGNNIANYVTTLAVGIGVGLVTTTTSDAVEVGMTLAAAPIVFLFGELVPKHVNYLTPMKSMRRKVDLFRIVFWIFRPLSIPLVWLTTFLERMFRGDAKATTAVLGRPQVRELLKEGRLGGVFTDGQAELTNRLLRLGTRSIRDNIRAMSFAFGLPQTATREEAIRHAHTYGLNHIPLHSAASANEWVASVRVAELLVSDASPDKLGRKIPRLEPTTSRLEAIQAIRSAASGFGIVEEAGKVLGFVSLQALARPLFQDAPAIAIAESQATAEAGN